MPGQPEWRLEGFHARLVEWAGRDHPPPWLPARVVEWLRTLELDPYHDAHPEPGANGQRWLRRVPDADTDGRAVVLSYGIDEEHLVIHCHRIELRDDPPESGH